MNNPNGVLMVLESQTNINSQSSCYVRIQRGGKMDDNLTQVLLPPELWKVSLSHLNTHTHTKNSTGVKMSLHQPMFFN